MIIKRNLSEAELLIRIKNLEERVSEFEEVINGITDENSKMTLITYKNKHLTNLGYLQQELSNLQNPSSPSA